ncbi:trichohyalin-like isoform X2 [Paramacrobiotus metropolitanus]|uniref:trichohyalin-like isoform X2 n=1 Tax=Paramacrobiotus metropolitanus TaxID=2943436 RepID=UPI00244659AD|nr:trichohyalin-like isoform X2 [Paramacrobiotus metropolitanus]
MVFRSSRVSNMPPKQPSSGRTVTKAPRPGNHPGASQPTNDALLISRLDELGQKVNPMELQLPQKSPRLITAVIPDLIQKATITPLDDALTKINETIDDVCNHPHIHPKLMETIGLPALINYFLSSVFHVDQTSIWFTARDVAEPSAKSIPRVLTILTNILAVTSQHDSAVLEHYQTMQDVMSELWNREVNLRGVEDQQLQREEQEKTECARMRELLETVENDATLENKLRDSALVLEKTVKKRDAVLVDVRRVDSELEQMRHKLKVLQSQIITPADAERVEKQLEETKLEAEAVRADLGRKTEDYSVRTLKNKTIQDTLQAAELEGKNFINYVEKACSAYIDLDCEKLLEAKRLYMVREDLEKARNQADRARADVDELKQKMELQKADRKNRQNQQNLHRSELQKEISSMKTKLKECAGNEDRLMDSIALEERAIQNSDRQIAEIMAQTADFVKKLDAQVGLMVQNVVSAKAETDRQLERMKYTVQSVYGDFPETPVKKPIPVVVLRLSEETKALQRELNADHGQSA